MEQINACKSARLSVAPMMQWTDRHCRVFHRLMSRHTLLYTEMVTSAAIIHGNHEQLLSFSECEQPLALQLGGSDPKQLAQACKIAETYSYNEINLNCGCPSDRVQSGAFGAVLMKDPDLVARCVCDMRQATDIPITVKCRIGVDDQNPVQVLPEFIAKISAAGVQRLTIHARKAWLKGVSPKDNRTIPALCYPLVYQMKEIFPHLHISINGGVTTLEEAKQHLEALDGVMIGRSAYHSPDHVLLRADHEIFNDTSRPVKTATDIVHDMLPYIETHLARGGRLNQVTRHMLGLFQGMPGARGWRRHLSEHACGEGASPQTLIDALYFVTDQYLK